MNRNRKFERKNKDNQNNGPTLFPRSLKRADRELFLHYPRYAGCLRDRATELMQIHKTDEFDFENTLINCPTIEHQIIALRSLIQLSKEDYEQRYKFTELLLTCFYRHHKVIYEGILFGSTVNGLGFHDSDVDLRLRPLKQVDSDVYEPVQLDKDMVDRVLRDIAYQTTRCSPAAGSFVPSTRVPVAKLVFVDVLQQRPLESLKYDISLSSTNPFGTLNSRFLRFLCHLEPKFHLLATVLRYWSTVHELIVPGYLSSYALVSMLIFFCQTLEPPLLPTINHMRDLALDKESYVLKLQEQKNVSQAEWNCIVCLVKELYTPSTNTEPLSLLLLKFFEFYLNFPYSTHLITTRPGKALTFEEYQTSCQFHPGFKLKPFLNIQDPFDLAHNLTSGMSGPHFRLLMLTMRQSYERLFKELLNNFTNPQDFEAGKVVRGKHQARSQPWGILTIFTPLTANEKKGK